MKKNLLAITVSVASILLFSASSYADMAISLGTPSSYTFTSSFGSSTPKAKSSLSGLLAHFRFSDHLGVGMTTVNQEVAFGVGDPSMKMSLTLYDFFYEFGLDRVNLSVGAGWGKFTISCLTSTCESTYPSESTSSEWAAAQYYVQVGAPFGMFDVHLGFSRPMGAMEVKPVAGGSETFKIDGILVSSGLSLEF